MVDTYAGRRFKMEGALFVALLAISRMRRRAEKRKIEGLTQSGWHIGDGEVL